MALKNIGAQDESEVGWVVDEDVGGADDRHEPVDEGSRPGMSSVPLVPDDASQQERSNEDDEHLDKDREGLDRVPPVELLKGDQVSHFFNCHGY